VVAQSVAQFWPNNKTLESGTLSKRVLPDFLFILQWLLEIGLESKAYFKSSGPIGEPDELANWQREVRQEFRRSCQSRYRSIFQDAFDAPQPLLLDELKSGKHHILFDCGIEAGQFQFRIDAVEKITRLSNMKYRGYIPIRFVPNERLSRHDKLLLAFDAYTLSLAIGMTPTIGKIMHGMDQRTVTIRLAPLISVVRLNYKPRTSTTCLEQALY